MNFMSPNSFSYPYCQGPPQMTWSQRPQTFYTPGNSWSPRLFIPNLGLPTFPSPRFHNFPNFQAIKPVYVTVSWDLLTPRMFDPNLFTPCETQPCCYCFHCRFKYTESASDKVKANPCQSEVKNQEDSEEPPEIISKSAWKKLEGFVNYAQTTDDLQLKTEEEEKEESALLASSPEIITRSAWKKLEIEETNTDETMSNDSDYFFSGSKVDWLIPRNKGVEKLPRPELPIYIQFEDLELYRLLLRYIPSWKQLQQLGYPVVSETNPGYAMIIKQASRKIFASNNHLQKKNQQLFAKSCVRCGETFFVLNDGRYATKEKCVYHWGKAQRIGEFAFSMTCCLKLPNSRGCTTGRLHVWSGLCSGVNELLKGYVRAKQVDLASVRRIFAVDCEMCYTTAGLELARVTLVNIQGHKIYDNLVKPEHEVIDFNTRYSGISEKDYLNATVKSLKETQQDLLQLIKTDTILIGHGLENDLRALKMIHSLVVDTAIIYPHEHGFPFRRSLKDLAEEVLNIRIQRKVEGHDSAEDARICLTLLLEKIKNDHNIRIVCDTNQELNNDSEKAEYRMAE